MSKKSGAEIGRLLLPNSATGNAGFDLRDDTIGGTGTAGTRNGYKGNKCATSSPAGLCAGS